MIAASIIRTVFGISTTMAETNDVIWTHFFFAFVCFIFEMSCVFAIFALTTDDFQQIGSPLAKKVVKRLYLLRMVFFGTWSCFPILWIISSTYMCVIDENASALLYLVADISCKNCYGLLLWSTTWVLLNGKWDRENARNRDEAGMLMETDKKQGVIKPPKENFVVKLFGTTIASVRRSTRRPRADLEFVDRSDRSDCKPQRRSRDYESDRSSDDSEHCGVSREQSRCERDYKRDYDKELRRDYDNRNRGTEDRDRRRRVERRDWHDDNEYDTRMTSQNTSTDLETQLMTMESSGNAGNAAVLLELLKKTTKPDAKNGSSMCCVMGFVPSRCVQMYLYGTSYPYTRHVGTAGFN